MEREFLRPPSGSVRAALLEVWEAHLAGVPVSSALAKQQRINGADKMSEEWACCTKCGLIKKEGELDYQHIAGHSKHLMRGFKSFTEAATWLETQRDDARRSSLKTTRVEEDELLGYPV